MKAISWNVNGLRACVDKGFMDHFNELDADADLPDNISFALLDGDFYDSIKTSLALVLPKLQSGATIIVHDYRNAQLPGSAKAVNEFIATHPELNFRLRAGLAIIDV